MADTRSSISAAAGLALPYDIAGIQPRCCLRCRVRTLMPQAGVVQSALQCELERVKSQGLAVIVSASLEVSTALETSE